MGVDIGCFFLCVHGQIKSSIHLLFSTPLLTPAFSYMMFLILSLSESPKSIFSLLCQRPLHECSGVWFLLLWFLFSLLLSLLPSCRSSLTLHWCSFPNPCRFMLFYFFFEYSCLLQPGKRTPVFYLSPPKVCGRGFCTSQVCASGLWAL